jgi:hypothetical protein
MAVRFDVPGIGTVEADNAASEATLQAILAAMGNDSPRNKKAQKADEEAAKAAQAKAKADQEGAKVGKEFSVGWAAAGNAAVKGLKDIGLTAVSMATKFGTDFVNIAENPIKETANMLNSLIDVGTNVVSSFAEAIPVIGAFIAAAAKAAAELAKAANKAFAEQLQRNIDTLQAYNKVGVGFVGGMTQMSNVAHDAGLGLVDFAKIVGQNKEMLNKLGLAGGEAATKLGSAMGVAAKQTNKAGLTLRDEMFKMGYTYEEQGAVFTSFMSNMQLAGKLRAMGDREIAEGTRKYATDLKVIADLTGQDAKKLAERSRDEALRGSLLAELSGDQVTAFQRANEMLTKAGPEVQAALTQYIKFGTITDPKVIANKELSTMIKNVGVEVKKGNTDMVNVTNREMANASKEMLSAQGKAFGSAVDSSLVAGVGGVAGDIAQVRNKFMAATYGLDPDAAKASAEANEDQATRTDQLADETAKLYDQTKKFQVQMEQLVNPELGRYAKLLKDVNDLTMGNFKKFIFGGEETKGFEGSGFFGKKVKQEPLKPAPYAHLAPKTPAREPYDLGAKIKEIMLPPKKYNSGGSIFRGGIGIAGENGPELISGPASVLSTASTAKLLEALNALKLLSGTLTGDDGIAKSIASTESLKTSISSSLKGFEGFDYNQLQSELSTRPEMNRRSAAMSGIEDDGTNSASSGLAEQMGELVRLMKQNVDQTTRVAMNTN